MWLDGAQVAAEVRALRPDYAALLIVAEGLRPGPSDEASDALLAAIRLPDGEEFPIYQPRHPSPWQP